MTLAGQQALRQAKRSLRKQMAVRLDAIPPSSLALQSAQITAQILHHESFLNATRVSIYVSMDKGEVQTEELCRKTLESGKRLYVPRFASLSAANGKFETDMKMLRVRDWDDFQAMVMNRWGIREPDEVVDGRQREDALDDQTGGDGLDLILAPGVAFDKTGGRLGHGKGYYDRYIERCVAFQNSRGRSRPVTREKGDGGGGAAHACTTDAVPILPCRTVALALQEQILAEERVPCDEDDQRLDNIITIHGPLLPPD